MFSGLFSPMHLIVILVIVLIIFGPGKLPELGNSLGKSIKNFKKAMDDPDGKIDAESGVKKVETEPDIKKIDESS
jgi:sec-independent protein translocase protein TatA